LPSTDRALFEGVWSGAAISRPVTETKAPSHEVRCTTEFCLQQRCEPIGLTRGRRASLFPTHPTTYPATGPRTLASSGSSSRARRPLQSSITAPSCTACPKTPCAPSMRFGSPSRHQCAQSTNWRGSHLAFVPPSAFLTLPTGYSCAHLADLFHSAATYEIHSSGILSRCRATHAFHRGVPSCRLPTTASSRVAPTVQRSSPRLQGLDPGSDSSRRAGGLDLLTTRFPLEFSTPAGVSPNTLAPPSRRLRS
jgi:hypothetical protein